MVALGKAVMALLEQRGIKATEFQWVYHPEVKRPTQSFEPHKELGGKIVKSIPTEDGLYPGDHQGCVECSAMPILRGPNGRFIPRAHLSPEPREVLEVLGAANVGDVVDDKVVVEKFSRDDIVEVVTDARLRGAALVDVAAFAEAKIGLAASMSMTSAFQNPGFGRDGYEDSRLVFQKASRPGELDGWGCPLTITEDGRIYGHATLRFRCHGAFESCVLPPNHGNDSLERFLIGDATGTGIPTGPIILNTTHGVEATGKIKSHDWLADTGTAVADVTAGFDQHGLWIAGKVRPGVTEREMAALRGSTLSAEWHSVPGTNKLEIVGILAVNSPGYLVRRKALAASLFTTGATACGNEFGLVTEDKRIEELEKTVAFLLKEKS